MGIKILACFIVTLTPVGVAFAGPADVAGDYTGWAYVNDGSDFPLWIHVTQTSDSTALTLSLPHQKVWALPTANVAINGDSLSFERRNSEGKMWTFKAALKAQNTIDGKATYEGQEVSYEFEVHRTSEPLQKTTLERPADYVGTYQGDGGQTMVISSWFWNELRFFDIQSGREGTLFQTASGDFILGPAMYIASPIIARLRFEMGEGGAMERLTWTSHGSSPVVLKRVRVQEEAVRFQNGNTHLGGTLLKPSVGGSFPVIVVMGGSDWTTRGQVRQRADIFVSMGLAALIYDQRGYGESTGSKVCSFDETATDAVAAITMLSGRSDVDKRRIGVFGVSRGGWFAPLVAAKTDLVSYLVMFVAPAVSPAKQENTRRLNALKAEGFSDAEVEQVAEYLKLLWKSTATDEDWDRYAKERDRIKDRLWFEIVDDLSSRDSDDFKWSRLNMQYDPLPVLERVKCPVLSLFGERDSNVVVKENLSLMEAAFKSGGNKDFSLKVLPKADHGLRPVETSMSDVPLHKATGYVPEVWPTVRDWLSARSIIRP